MSLVDPQESDLFTRAMFGEHAAHVPCQLAIQDMGDGVVVIVGASKYRLPHPLRFGSTALHQLIQGDLIVRPHWVGESRNLAGVGASALLTSSAFANPDEWVTILSPLGVRA